MRAGGTTFEVPAARTGSDELVLTNARVVLRETTIEGSVVVDRGCIRVVDDGRSHLGSAIDLDGDLLLPGLVDLHTDSLERHYQPRRGVEWDAVAAAMSHDVQVAGSGITTVFDSLTLGAAWGWEMRPEAIEPIVGGLRVASRNGMLRASHLLHMRCEVTHPDIVAIFERHLDDPLLAFMSLMDHAPGDRQSPDVDAYRRRYHGILADEAATDRHIEGLIHGSRAYGPSNRRALARLASERSIPFATHDDRGAEHVEEAHALGAVLSEFPTTVEAAETARNRGLHVLMGAPNLLRDGSHTGNVAASALARRGVLDLLASDYVPSSLLHAAFRLTGRGFDLPLHRAIAMVSAVPADTAGLADRGRIEPGLRADLVRVREIRDRPVVRSVWSAGQRVL